MSAIKFAYNHLPVSCRMGEGQYTYQYIVENDAAVTRYEIFANSIAEAINWVAYYAKAPVSNYAAIDATTWQLYFAHDAYNRYYLYLV